MKMKHGYIVTRILIASCLLMGNLIAQKGPKDKFDFPALGKISMPEVHETILPNGMKLFLVEDKEYPTIDVRAMIRTGSIYEPADKVGLAYITGSVIRTGGSKTMPGDALDELLETMGATVETGIGGSSGNLMISVFKEDIEKGLGILADLLMNPAFPQEKIDLAKIECRSAISRRNDDVGQITGREFEKLIYGADSPWARDMEYATVDAVTQNDIIAFHRKFFHPDNILCAVWGDFDWKKMKKMIEKTFAAWKPGKSYVPPVPKIAYDYNFSVNYIEKTDINQSNIQLGHIGGMMNNPDYPALSIMNQILSFDRMFKRIRTDEGLAYNVWGAYGADLDHPGTFSSGCQTKSESTVKAVRIMLEELKKIQQSEVTDEELKKAKETFLNGYVFNFDSRAKIVGRLMTYDYYGYPRNFMDTIKEGIEKVTKADILRAAKTYLHPDKVRILVVGNQANFDEPLTSLGNVTVIDISIPMPGQKESITDATPKALEQGRDLFKKAAEASGGSEVFVGIKNVNVMLKLTQVTPMGEMSSSAEMLTVYPDKLRGTLSTPGGNVEMVLVGPEGWFKSPQGTMPMPDMYKKSFRESILRDPIRLFQNQNDVQVQYIGKKELEGRQTEELLVSYSDYSFHLLLDAETCLPAAYIYTDFGQSGPQEKTEVFSDYKKFDGCLLPMKSISYADGKKDSETMVTDYQLNISVDEKIFQKE
jgi:zinc protease